MVVDDQHVGLLGLLTGLHQRTVAQLRAVLSQAVVAGGGGELPGGVFFGELGAAGAVAGLAEGGKALDDPQSCRDLRVAEAPVTQGTRQVHGADIVGTALEHRHGGIAAQGLPDARHVTLMELVLQLAGGGGQQHALARKQRRHQVRKGLADAGAGIDHQHGLGVDGIGNGLGHFLLAGTLPVAGILPCQRPPGPEGGAGGLQQGVVGVGFLGGGWAGQGGCRRIGQDDAWMATGRPR